MPHATPTPLPQADWKDSLATVMKVAAPTIAKGVIIRRPAMVGTAERFDLDAKAVQHLQKLHKKYGPGPLMLRVPGPPRAVILGHEDACRVLDESPQPFAPASSEKRAALDHFEPKNALVSKGVQRALRRRFNEQVLEFEQPVHHLADAFLKVVEEEAGALMNIADRKGELDWPAFTHAWERVVRRVILGDRARDDQELTETLEKLRGRGNWAMFAPQAKKRRARFHARLAHYLERADGEALSSVVNQTPQSAETAPTHQMAQWFFAFDPAGMAVFRSLALLATHPAQRDAARSEIESAPGNKPYLRACFLEALRLWPTTPAVLRETTEPTQWREGTMPEGTGILIFAPYFHRDERSLPFAHRFAPEIWLREEEAKDAAKNTPEAKAGTGTAARKENGTEGGITLHNWPLIPFSRGPATCPAQNLVPFLTSNMLAALLRGRHVSLTDSTRLGPNAALPATLNNYSLRFGTEPATV